MEQLSTEEFLRALLPVATATEQATGVPRYYLLAMHVSEQGRTLHPPGNMCFGIKAGPNWHGRRQLLRTWEVFDSPHQNWPHQVFSVVKRSDGRYRYELMAEFRAYDSIAGSYADHAAFLQQNPRYHAAWAHKGNDLEFTRAVVAAGYATDPEKWRIMSETIMWLHKKAADYGLN